MTTSEYNKTVDVYADRLFRFIVKSCNDAEMAQDIVQDTFLKVWEKVEEIQYESVKPYLFKVAYHTMIDKIRRQKPQIDIDYCHPPGMAEDMKNYELPELLNQALEQLPVRYKTLVLLRDYEGYSYQEIADSTGLSLEQVKVYIFRARKTLKKILVSVETVL